jgi:hypothetical protein
VADQQVSPARKLPEIFREKLAFAQWQQEAELSARALQLITGPGFGTHAANQQTSLARKLPKHLQSCLPSGHGNQTPALGRTRQNQQMSLAQCPPESKVP